MSEYTLDPSVYEPICEAYPAGVDLMAVSETGYIEFRKVLEGYEPSDSVDSSDETAWKSAWKRQFQEFLEASEAKTAVYNGRDITREAADPDWELTWSCGLDLLPLTKDMRLMARLLLAGLSTGGPARMVAVCDYILKTVESYWDSFQPPPEDGEGEFKHFDRIKPLKEVLERPGFQKVLGTAVLYQSPRVKEIKITNRFLDIALAGAEKVEKEFALDRTGFEQFLADEPAAGEALAAAGRAAATAAELLGQIEAATDRHPGSLAIKSGNAADALRQLAKRLAPFGTSTEQEEDMGSAPDVDSAPALPSASVGAAPEINVGGIGSKADALATIRAVRVYLADEAPSSPLPLLLEQVEAMFGASFPDLVRLIAPKGWSDPALCVNLKNHGEQSVPLGDTRRQAVGAIEDLAAVVREMRETSQARRNPLLSLLERGEIALQALRDAVLIEAGTSPVGAIDSHGKARAALTSAAAFMEKAEPSHPSTPFLQRIVALIGQDFISLMRELMPQGPEAIKLALASPAENEE